MGIDDAKTASKPASRFVIRKTMPDGRRMKLDHKQHLDTCTKPGCEWCSRVKKHLDECVAAHCVMCSQFYPNVKVASPSTTPYINTSQQGGKLVMQAGRCTWIPDNPPTVGLPPDHSQVLHHNHLCRFCNATWGCSDEICNDPYVLQRHDCEEYERHRFMVSRILSGRAKLETSPYYTTTLEELGLKKRL